MKVSAMKKALTEAGKSFAANASDEDIKRAYAKMMAESDDDDNDDDEQEDDIFAQIEKARELRAQGGEKIRKEAYNPKVHGPKNKLRNGMDDEKFPYKTSFGEVQSCTEFTSSRGNKLYQFVIEVEGSLAYATGQKALEEGTFVKFQSKQLPAGQYAELDKNGEPVVVIVPNGRTLFYQSLIGVKKATRETIETSILIHQNKELLNQMP